MRFLDLRRRSLSRQRLRHDDPLRRMTRAPPRRSLCCVTTTQPGGTVTFLLSDIEGSPSFQGRHELSSPKVERSTQLNGKESNFSRGVEPDKSDVTGDSASIGLASSIGGGLNAGVDGEQPTADGRLGDPDR